MPVATEKQIREIENTARGVWHGCYRDIFSDEKIRYLLQKFQSEDALKQQIRDNYIFYMLLVDNELAGYLCFKNNGDHIFIQNLYVLEEYRRMGLARRAVMQLDRMVSGEEFRNIKKLKLRINRDNLQAIDVCEKLGFRKTRSIDTDMGNGFYCNDYLMERNINRNKVDDHG